MAAVLEAIEDFRWLILLQEGEAKKRRMPNANNKRA